MISFELTQEQKLAQSMVQELAAAQLRPAARDADDREAIPSSILDQLWATGIVQSQAEAGGYSPSLNALLLEELAVADAAFAIAAAAPIGFLGARHRARLAGAEEESPAALRRRQVSMRRRRRHGARLRV